VTKAEGRIANRRLAKVAVQCSVDTFVVNQILVLRINICGKSPALAGSWKPLTSSINHKIFQKFILQRLSDIKSGK